MEGVDAVLRSAFKNSHDRKANLKRYLVIPESSGAFVAKIDDKIAGFGAAMDYGPFSYIGKMGVDPRIQRRGVGGTILAKLLEWLEDRKCPTVLLDASQYGGPLYEKFGFIESDLTAVLQQKNRSKKHSNEEHGALTNLPKIMEAVELKKLLPFDLLRFGADRSALLRSFFDDDPNRFLISYNREGEVDGFLVAQPRVIGPWVASSPEAAEGLLDRALEFSFDENPTIFVSASNRAALALLSKYGFDKQRTQRHMYRGKLIERDRKSSIYAQANFSFG